MCIKSFRRLLLRPRPGRGEFHLSQQGPEQRRAMKHIITIKRQRNIYPSTCFAVSSASLCPLVVSIHGRLINQGIGRDIRQGAGSEARQGAGQRHHLRRRIMFVRRWRRKCSEQWELQEPCISLHRRCPGPDWPRGPLTTTSPTWRLENHPASVPREAG